jgi:hypothetical protein
VVSLCECNVLIKPLNVVSNLVDDHGLPCILHDFDLIENLIDLGLIIHFLRLSDQFFDICEGVGDDVHEEIIHDLKIVSFEGETGYRAIGLEDLAGVYLLFAIGFLALL